MPFILAVTAVHPAGKILEGQIDVAHFMCDSEFIDERCWGRLIADLVPVIAASIAEHQSFDLELTEQRLRSHVTRCLREQPPGTRTPTGPILNSGDSP